MAYVMWMGHPITLCMLGCLALVGCSDDASGATGSATDDATAGTAGDATAAMTTTPGATSPGPGDASADGDTTLGPATDSAADTTMGGASEDATASSEGSTSGGTTSEGTTSEGTTSGGTTDGGTTDGGTTDGGSTDEGSTDEGSTDGGSTDDGNNEPPCGSVIPTVYRDLQPLHVDFGCHMWGNDAYPGLVLEQLGADLKPQYNPAPPPPPAGWNGAIPQITNAASFLDWYNTNPGVNLEIAGQIQLTETAPGSGIWSFSDSAFYPLTGQGFGNNVTPNWSGETYPNWNGAFTTEIHVQFQYEPGQEFTYIGDDDVWVYIDGDLALDLGGLHGPVQGTIVLDDLALTPGQTYTLDVFHAERCGSGSHFQIETSIGCLDPV